MSKAAVHQKWSPDIAEGIPSVDRVDATTVGFTVDEYPAAYRMIRVLYKHVTQ